MDEIEFSSKVQKIIYPTLREFGYEYSGVRDISTKAIPKWMKASFKNSRAARILEVGYIPACNGGREVLKCHISDLNFKPDEFDYTSSNQMTVPSIRISDLDPSVSDKVEIVLKSIEQELKEKFVDVLLGKRFRTEQIDWQGLK